MVDGRNRPRRNRFLGVVAVLALAAAALRRCSNRQPDLSFDASGADGAPDYDLGPVTVYSGDYTEAVFLKSLIESAGIKATLVTPHRHGGP